MSPNDLFNACVRVRPWVCNRNELAVHLMLQQDACRLSDGLIFDESFVPIGAENHIGSTLASQMLRNMPSFSPLPPHHQGRCGIRFAVDDPDSFGSPWQDFFPSFAESMLMRPERYSTMLCAHQLNRNPGMDDEELARAINTMAQWWREWTPLLQELRATYS